MSETSPLLSIHCITYNHRDYIRQTLEGFIAQQTDFPFQAIVADDCSPDNTAEIIAEYAAKYPDIIKPVYHKRNLGSRLNGISAYEACGDSKYLAFCEGDDYWSDPHKLQKQVDFLEAHPDYSLCFHKVREFHDDSSQPDKIEPSPSALKKIRTEGGFTPESILNQFYCRLNSVVVRRRYNDRIIDYPAPEGIINGDIYLCYCYSLLGKIGFIDEVMSAYRIHGGGVWSGLQDRYEEYRKYGISQIRCFEALKKVSPPRLQKELDDGINYKVRSMFHLFLERGDFESMEKLREAYPEHYRYNLDFCPLPPNNNARIRLCNYYLENGGAKLLTRLCRTLWRQLRIRL